MASIAKKTDGRTKPWVVTWREPGTGKQRGQGFVTEDEAKGFRDRVGVDLREGMYVSREPRPFKTYAEDWLARRRPNISPNTAALYETMIRTHLVKAFGATPLQKLTPLLIERWQSDLLTTRAHAPRTVQIARGVLGAILRDACAKDVLKRNPMEKVAGVKVPERELQYLTPEQITALCKAVGAYYAVLFLVLAYCGLRIAEATALQWRDLDLARGRLLVRRQVIWLRKQDRRPGQAGWEFRPPKSKAGKRPVEVPAGLARLLEEHRLRLAVPNPHGLVFPSEAGGPLDDNNLRYRVFKPALVALGAEGVRLHDFRRSFFAAHVQAETHPKQIQDRLGHARMGVTMDVYGKLAGRLPLSAEQTARLDALVDGAAEGVRQRLVNMSVDKARFPPTPSDKIESGNT